MLKLFITLCNVDKDYQKYVVMKTGHGEGDWEQCTHGFDTREEAEDFMETNKHWLDKEE